MIKYIQGDLFDTEADIIAHGVNCSDVFGAGVAKQMAHKYPLVKDFYHAICHQYSSMGFGLGMLLGTVQPVKVSGSLTILNCFTQKEYGNDGMKYVDYKAIEDCFKQIKEKHLDKGRSVAMPKIGAGLGGGDWKIIEGIINGIVGDKEILVYVKK